MNSDFECVSSLCCDCILLHKCGLYHTKAIGSDFTKKDCRCLLSGRKVVNG